MTLHESQIAIALGRKGSGKSQLLHDLFTSQAPRVLTIGHIRQDLERDPQVIKTLGRAQLYQALERASGYDAWHIAAALEPEDLAELFTLLAPPLGSPRESLSLAFGGLAIECGEAYEIMPNGRTPDELLAGMRRSRHYSLDWYLGSQRPASIARDATGLADLIFAFAQSEPRDIAFLAESVSRPFADQVRQLRLEEYRCVVHNRDDGTSRLLGADRSTVGRLDEMAGAAGR